MPKIDLEKIRKQLRNLNRELTNAIGHKSVYGYIDIDVRKLIEHGWIKFYFSKALTEKEKKQVIKILEKYFGDILDRPAIYQNFKSEKGKYGYRWNTYEFLSYTKIKGKPLWDVKPKKSVC